jgi:hypothetical protein
MSQRDDSFLGIRKARIQSYLILGALLVIGIFVADWAIKHKDMAEHGVHRFMGLPGWAFPMIGIIVGMVIFWGGLHTEADWPEVVGSFIVAGSVVFGEHMIGWKKFMVGGIGLIPYVIPIGVLLLLLAIGQQYSD